MYEASEAGSLRSERPPKPPGSSWTDEQWEAIRLRGSDILVAAAAGSGKTAVLVERIIRRIADERDPVDVDRLLVATFTNAAAGEMRQRIREAIEKRLAAQPGSEHLRRQAALIHRASITTLHSFCLDVIRRHHMTIELDPAFRIANETEAELMRQQLLTELLEEQYEQSGEDSDFWRLADAFGGERGDDALVRLIQQLYDYSRSHPWPDRWLLETAARFETMPASPAERPDAAAETSAAAADGAAYDPWRQSLIGDVKLELEGMAAGLREALRLAGRPGGPAPYIANLEDDLAQIERALAAADASWDELHRAIGGVSFGKLNACRGEIDKSLQEQVKQLRDRVKEQLADLREELFERTPEQYAAEMRELAPVMRRLAELVIEFGERYRKAKADKGLVDFSDLEHYCLAILRHPDSSPGKLLPSKTAEEYREHFVEILIDEYQDTNTVQEAILELLSRPAPGNRFMVGDVKQSIYRFRLADPGLFLVKYKSYDPAGADDPQGGRKIDLARNFRSRREIVDAVNFVFRQVMTEHVGEMDYGEDAQLVCGADYPESRDDMAVEFALIDRGMSASDERGQSGGAEEDEEGADAAAAERSGGPDVEQEEQQAETAQLEARFIVSHIRRLMGLDGGKPMLVYDRGAGGMRPLVFRDIAILLRATSQWAPIFLEELSAAGIPAYAELNTGYFSATEVAIVLSLLQIVDNPYQDIPLAAALRSPMFGLTAAELAQIRIKSRRGPFYEAVLAYASDERPENPSLKDKLARFCNCLSRWRDEARQGSLAELIWRLYRETGYYDFVGGLPGGLQRQANLRALYDRARQYEATSLRGLFRFLRFIERMRDSGADLGAARALGEQEDVVRIMSIHKSKGLEFPVVYVAGLGKTFNRTDLNGPFLMHKTLGFGPMSVDPDRRVAFPSLPLLAIRRRMKAEMTAEELRVLYVALTRPKEKLVLVGTVPSADAALQKWNRMRDEPGWELPPYEMARARCYLDWLGPALVRHPQAAALRVPAPGRDAQTPGPRDPAREAQPAEPSRRTAGDSDAFRPPQQLADEPSRWLAGVLPSAGLAQAAAAVEAPFTDARMEAVARLEPVPGAGDGPASREVERRFGWTYPYAQASEIFSNTSVSELKRLWETVWSRGEGGVSPFPGLLEAADGSSVWPGKPSSSGGASAEEAPAPDYADRMRLVAGKRPKFIGERKLTAAERGSVYHAVMQYMPLDGEVTEETVRATLERMVRLELIAEEHRAAVDAAVVVSFFRAPIGQRLLRARRVWREVPFSHGLPAEEVHIDAAEAVRGEMVLVRGTIDCLFEDDSGLVLLDYKTDATFSATPAELAERYRIQLSLYALAVERIWKRPVAEKVLFFFDGPLVVPVD